MSIADALRGWTPIWIDSSPDGAWVDWCHAGGSRFDEPFYAGSVERLLQRPFNTLFRHRTAVESLLEFSGEIPGGEPAGFTFHMTRCGSTLVSRALSSLDHSLALSEPEPAERLLRLLDANPGLDPMLKTGLLRGLMGAFGNARPDAERLFVKFDAWNIHDLSLLRRAFPDTPWMFLYREPEQVLVSQARALSGSLMAGTVPPGCVGLTLEQAAVMQPLEYIARALGSVLQTAAESLEKEGGGRLFHYSELPDALRDAIPMHFGVSLNAREVQRVRAAAGVDAKSPDRAYKDDRQEKQRVVDNVIRDLAAQWLEPIYQTLEQMRHRERAG